MSKNDARAMTDTAINGDRSRVDGNGGRGGATQVTNATIARADGRTAGCH